MTRNWAHLPILGQIFNRLSISTYCDFKLVCKFWYCNVREEDDISISYPIKSPPWLAFPMLCSNSEEEEEEGGIKDNDSSSRSISSYYNLVDNKVLFDDEGRFPTRKQAYCVGSCHGWLAFLDISCVLYLENPFKSIESSVIQLPPIHTLPCILSVHPNASSPPSLSIVDFMYDRYQFNQNLKVILDGPTLNIMRQSRTSMVSSNELYHYFVGKLVMSSSPKDPSCIVMIIYGEYGKLAYCRVGDTSWTTLNGKLRKNDDIYYSSEKKQFYVVYNHDFSFETWDLKDLSSSSEPRSTFFKLPKCLDKSLSLSSHEKKVRYMCDEKAYLAESHNGDLLWVVKYFALVNADTGLVDNKIKDHREHQYRLYRFDVYKLNWRKKKWVQVNSLNGDGVLFLGVNNAMAFSARDFPCLQSKSIYFVDDCICYGHSGHSYGGHDLGVFSLKNDIVYPTYLKAIHSPLIWLTPYPW